MKMLDVLYKTVVNPQTYDYSIMNICMYQKKASSKLLCNHNTIILMGSECSFEYALAMFPSFLGLQFYY